MFCLRSWLGLLVFLSNAPPVYVALYILGNFALQRPCVYCSILLTILCFSLLDFSSDWFEPRWQPTVPVSETLSHALSGNATLQEMVWETAGLAVSALNGTGGSLASAAIDGARRKLAGGDNATVTAATTANGFELLRTVVEKRGGIRIPCVDVTIRL
ncbi:hypothetical protein D0864_03842 [Hortaea werneckii]|uniref:Uncharacterized protein n=1 Tax=Hortaea werneckii TaxID=91943 RepID=A0A3M7GHC6_HORWE|nr:hypothetical protein KC345_g2599 [Hortaea werneckii]RMZ00085.1 hypothetical protein D0864_03842 [Hortaea werneckii]